MKILAFETSGRHWGVAAVECLQRGVVLPRASQLCDQPRALSRDIIGVLDVVLQQAGWTLDDVEAAAVGLGPGSWTGLRIGLSTVKTLAQARGWQLAGVPSFDAEAQAAWRFARGEDESGDGGSFPATIILATAPCRPGEVYGKLYECHENYLSVVHDEWIGPPEMMAAAALSEAIALDIEAPPILTGEGTAVMAATMDEQFETYLKAEIEPASLILEIAVAGAVALFENKTASPFTLQPLYLAPSAAERNLKASN